MLKNKYQRMTKEEKKKIRTEYYNTPTGKQNKNRFIRVIIISIFCLIYSIYMGIENYMDSKITVLYVYYSGVLITGIILLISCIRIRGRILNDYALKKKKEK